jgi:hypothetical protein
MLFRHRSRTQGAGSAAPRGQSLVEFGLVLPLLILLLLGVADFGRVFADGITLEAAARDGAEAAAQEYLQLARNSSGGVDTADYGVLHDLALEVSCREAERLSDRVLDGSGNCVSPAIAVCIHDDEEGDALAAGGECGIEAGSAPAECTQMDGATNAWNPTRFGPFEGLAYIEVRMCYRFDPLIPITGFWWGSVWLQKDRTFTVADY